MVIDGVSSSGNSIVIVGGTNGGGGSPGGSLIGSSGGFSGGELGGCVGDPGFVVSPADSPGFVGGSGGPAAPSVEELPPVD